MTYAKPLVVCQFKYLSSFKEMNDEIIVLQSVFCKPGEFNVLINGIHLPDIVYVFKGGRGG